MQRYKKIAEYTRKRPVILGFYQISGCDYDKKTNEKVLLTYI